MQFFCIALTGLGRQRADVDARDGCSTMVSGIAALIGSITFSY
jgi:hypothetical protein